MKRILGALALAGVAALGIGPAIHVGQTDISWGASTIHPPAL